MTQILKRLPDKYGQRYTSVKRRCLPLTAFRGLNILCSYQNKTSTVQIVRITNIRNWYFERVVFPGELVLFKALTEAVFEVYSSDQITIFLSDRFLCDRLKVS